MASRRRKVASRRAHKRWGKVMSDGGLIEDDRVAEEKRKKAGRPPREKLNVDKKWFDDRMRDLKLTQSAVAVAIGRDRTVLNRALAGTRTPTGQEIAGLHRVLKASAREILKRLGYQVAQEGVPVVGKIMGDSKISTVTARKGVVLDIAGFPHDAHAYVAETEGTPLSAYEGAAFVCQIAPVGQTPVPPEAVGRLAVVEADAHPLPMLGTVNKVLSRGSVAFTLFGTNERLSLQKVHRVEVVLGIKFP